MNLAEAIRELYFYKQGTAGGFQTALFDLFFRADEENKKRLAFGFPGHYLALQMWEASGDYGNDLFRKHGLQDCEAKNKDIAIAIEGENEIPQKAD
jgi:hypothetical protein